MEAWVDTIVVKQQSIPITLKQLLYDTFNDTYLNYFFDGPNILITNNYPIHATLPENFFLATKEELQDITNTTEVEKEVRYAFVDPGTKKQTQGVLRFGDPKRSKGGQFTLSGVIRDANNGEAIIGGQLFVQSLNTGTVSDINGNYSITLPKGSYELLFKYLGKKDINRSVLLYDNGVLNIDMEDSPYSLKEIVITAESESNVHNLKTGSLKLNMEEIKHLPAFMGEVDIIKSVTLLPGVQTVAEGSSGFNVRGGSADQNLVLLDEMPIFNSSHLFGFFSVFNPETVKDFELYKSGIPARLFYKRLFNPKLYGNISAIYSNYKYGISSNEDPALGFNLDYDIDYQSVKTSLFYLPNAKHTINSGFEAIKYKIAPGSYTPYDEKSDIMPVKLPDEHGIEAGVFLNDDFEINNKLSVSAGLRYAMFFAMGPAKVYEYQPNVSRTVESRVDSTMYPSGRIIKTYGGPELRISTRYRFGENSSLKFSYNRIHQLLHMLTNSTVISPTDIWKMSGECSCGGWEINKSSRSLYGKTIQKL